MQVRAKIMAFDGLRRVRPGQICEVEDSLIKRDAEGNIVRPRWAVDVNEPLPIPATTPYPRKAPEVAASVFKSGAPAITPAVEPLVKRGRSKASSESVI